MSRTINNTLIFALFLTIMVICAGCSSSEAPAYRNSQDDQDSSPLTFDPERGAPYTGDPMPDDEQVQPSVSGPLEGEGQPVDKSASSIQGPSITTEPLNVDMPYSVRKGSGPLGKRQ